MKIALAVVVCLAVGCLAQTGRFEESKRLGFAYLKDGKYDKAAAKLEEVYEIDKSDPSINEALAIAYMNGEDRKNNPDIDAKAFAILDQALAGGGRVPLLVHLNLGRSISLSMSDFCAGRLVLQQNRLSFFCERGSKASENSFDVTGEAIQEMGEKFGRGKGMFFVKIEKHTLDFVPSNWEQKHSQFFLDLARKYLKVQKFKG